MFIKWIPYRYKEPVKYSQPQKDALQFNDKEPYDFSSMLISEFDVDNVPFVLEAKRIDGQLYLDILYFFDESQEIKVGTIYFDKYVDYGEKVELEL